MLMTLPHAHTQTHIRTHTHTLRVGPASFSDKVLLPPAVLMAYIIHCYHDNKREERELERGCITLLLICLSPRFCV